MNKKMKIGMILDNEFHNDARVQNEAKSLSEAGHQVFILCLNDHKSDRITNINGIKIIRTGKDSKWRNRYFFFANLIPCFHKFWKSATINFIKEFNIEMVHAHDLYMAKSAYFACSVSNIPFVIDLHENFPAAVYGYKWAVKFPNRLFTRPQKWNSFEQKYLPKANKIIVLSQAFKNQLIEKHPQLQPENIYIYSNVPDIDQLEKHQLDANILPQGNYIFYFGGIAERRGIFTSIDALSILIKNGHKDLKLLLIGPVDKAENDRFQSAINNEELKNNIIFYPWKDISELPSYILASSICISPIVKNAQHESGVANKVFQYMLFEKPVIVSDCKPQVEIIEQSKAGLVFKSEDPNDLAEKIQYLFVNSALCSEMGRNGKDAVIKKYNRKEMGKNLVRMYEEF
jgi:glycosyltransferase involved in cell wall biosynthesis